jgi:hypothetical protein
MNKEYIEFIAGLKQNIIQSRYIAAKLANKEQLLLYFRTGKMLSEKIAAEKWGAKVLEQISEDLQKALPGLRGFSYRNLMNMKKFYIEYHPLTFLQSPTAQLQEPILPSPTAEIDKSPIGSSLPIQLALIRPSSTAQLPESWYIHQLYSPYLID